MNKVIKIHSIGKFSININSVFFFFFCHFSLGLKYEDNFCRLYNSIFNHHIYVTIVLFLLENEIIIIFVCK